MTLRDTIPRIKIHYRRLSMLGGWPTFDFCRRHNY